jgi:tetratricopeptide (TPR) repeat protein
MATPTRTRKVALIVFADETTRSSDLVRCLESAADFVDSWHVITSAPIRPAFEALVHGTFSSKPGELYSEVGIDEAQLRSQAFARIAPTADYVLLLKARHEVVVEPGYNIEGLKSTLNRTVYRILVKSNSTVRPEPLLLNSSYQFYFRGEFEPILDCHDTVEAIGSIDGLHVRNDDASPRRRNVPSKLSANITTLEGLARATNDSKLRHHYASLAARGHIEAGRFAQALEWHEQLSHYAQTEDDICEALLEMGHCARMLQQPSSRILDLYMRAYDANPLRAEPLYYAARALRESNRSPLAYVFAKAAVETKRPAIRTSLNVDVYEWRALFELSIVAFYVDEYNEGVRACRSVLAHPLVPETERALTKTNLSYYIRALTQVAS